MSEPVPMITMDEYMEAQESDLGWCTSCKKLAGECVEPDAEDYECTLCGEMTVTGIESALMEGLVAIDTESSDGAQL
jgi:hypothetical protein